MSELSVDPDVGYRPGMNPEFVKRAQERRRQREAQDALRRKQEERIQRERDAARKITLRREQDAIASVGINAEARFQSLVQDLRQRNPTTVVPVREIIEAVAAKHGFTRAQILGPARNQKIVNARHEAMAEAYRMRPELSLTQLGRQFSRDHTTLMSALRKMGVYPAA